MKRKEFFFSLLIVCSVTAVFFYKTLLRGQVPFPADILVSDFQPWRSTSYEGYAPGGIPNKAQYPDTIRQMYPWKTLVIQSLKKGKLPLWNPYNFSGTPLLANFQSAALYPLGFLYLIFAQIDAWTILIILQPVLAALFTYLYSRKIGMSPYGSALSALSYGFSGFMAVWLEYNTVGHVILWLPLILLAIEHIRSKPKPVWLMILASAHVCAILAGHPQVYAYELFFSGIYGWFRLPKNIRWYFFGFTLLGVGVAGLQLIPGIELISLAARSPHDFSTLFGKILVQPWQLIAFVFPNIFGNPATRTYWPADTFVGKVTTIGLVPLFFLLSAGRNKNPLVRWFIISALFVIIFVTANPITWLLYQLPIPILSSSSPTLMMFLFTFSAAIITGLGLDHWLTEPHTIKKLIKRTGQVCIIFLGLFVSAKLSPHAAVSIRAIIYGSIVASATLLLFWVAVTKPKFRYIAILVLLVVHTGDLCVFFIRFNPFIPKSLVFPDHPILSFLKEKAPDRYWGYGTADISANFASQYGIFSPEGYDPLYPKWYGEYLYSHKNFTDATRSDAAITSSFGDGGLSGSKKQALLNALSVRYILDRIENGSNEQTYPTNIYKPIYQYEDWRVYENLTSTPRAYLHSDIAPYIAAHITSYQPEKIVIQVHANKKSKLILTDTYFPGWLATIDTKKSIIQRTNTTFREVDVPSGDHTVVMTYEPKSVYIGWLVSIGSIFGVIIMVIYIQYRYEYKK
jgi:hypothetical protein